MRKFLIVLFLMPFNLWAQETKVFVFLNSKPDKAEISEDSAAELMKQHLANIDHMVADGRLLVAGPFEGGGGIFIFNTSDVGITKKWLESDPAIRANRWNLEVFKINFSKGGACLATEPYEMVTYNFLRVDYINDIANYKMNNSNVPGWQDAAKSDSVLAVGRFPQFDGGVIIYSGNPDANWREKFSTDQISFDIKKLWVARGSFCE
jgi:uncharacterized protein YciI